MAEANIKAIIPGDLRKVWDFVLDIENYDTWRSDLGKTEIISEKQFLNTPKMGILQHLPLQKKIRTDAGNLIWKTAI